MIDEKRRVSFDSVASMYEEARPSYPDRLIDDVLDLSGIKSGDRILEIGAGTGKATAMFASRGQSVLAIEPGKEMAAIAENKFETNPEVQVQLSKFEDWDDRGERFGIVAAAQSFHWVDPTIKYLKSAAVLKPGGYIALFWNTAYGLDREIWHRLDEIYRNYFQSEQAFFLREQAEPLSPNKGIEASIAKRENELKDSGKFGKINTLCYNWTREYPRADFLKLLNTFSDHRILDEDKREKLFSRIGAFIDSLGGTIAYPYKSVLHLAEVKTDHSLT